MTNSTLWQRDNNKLALVLGGAECVAEDLLKLGDIPESCDIIAVNNAGFSYSGKLKYWVTLHPEEYLKWKQRRNDNGYDMNYISIGYGNKKQNRIPTETDEWSNDWGGSGGLYACKIALEKGYEKVILCGVPMDTQKNFYNKIEFASCFNYRIAWNKHLDELKGKVYSMSGWTKEILGGFKNERR